MSVHVYVSVCLCKTSLESFCFKYKNENKTFFDFQVKLFLNVSEIFCFFNHFFPALSSTSNKRTPPHTFVKKCLDPPSQKRPLQCKKRLKILKKMKNNSCDVKQICVKEIEINNLKWKTDSFM